MFKRSKSVALATVTALTLAVAGTTFTNPTYAAPPIRAPKLQNCTYTQGYWKNHRSSWPISSLTIGKNTYTATQLMNIFNTTPNGDATYILAHQFIAASLNVAQGASNTSIASTLSAAQTWFMSNPLGSNPSGSARELGIQYSTILDNFNNGLIGPGHCGDAPNPTTVPPTAVPPTAVPPTAVPPTAVPPTAVPPTAVPPTAVPPTAVPPTAVPPTAVPPTAVPPTAVPPTAVPPTAVPPTAVPPTAVPPTAVPPTAVPPTAVPPTAVPTVAPVVVEIAAKVQLTSCTLETTVPVRGVTVYLYAGDYWENPEAAPLAQTTTDANGLFRFKNVADGEYSLVYKDGYNVATSFATVSGENVTAYDIDVYDDTCGS